MPNWRGLIVALPDPVDTEAITEPEIVAALGMVKRSESPIIEQCRGMALLQELGDTLPTEPPFAQLPGKAVGMVFDEMLRDLQRASLMSEALEAEIRRTENRLIEAVAQFWSPLILAESRVSAKYPENWELVMHWQRWITETGDLKELTSKFLGHLSNGPASAVGKAEVTAFRKRLEYLGLPASAESIRVARSPSSRG